MLFKSKQGKHAKESGSRKRIDKDDLYPVLHVAGSVCFYRCIQCQDIGLVSNGCNLACTRFNLFDGF